MPTQKEQEQKELDAILDRQFVMTDAGRIDWIRDLYTAFNDEVDLDALKEGGYIRIVGGMMEPVTMSLDDHAPEVIAYWAKRGMVKEFHGEDVPMNWSEYELKTGYHWHDEERRSRTGSVRKRSGRSRSCRLTRIAERRSCGTGSRAISRA